MSEQNTVGTSNLTLPDEREIRVERLFDAPPERVFAAYTDPELIPQWWGPHGTTTTVEELDARKGGRWQFRSQGSDGSEIVFRGYFREVEAPTRISQTFEWDGMPGYVSVETVTFEPVGEQTLAVSTSIFHSGEERDGMIGSGMEKGMNETFERLDTLLARA
jgi:uncharacterized protein YndB with AHSA1/START domain